MRVSIGMLALSDFVFAEKQVLMCLLKDTKTTSFSKSGFSIVRNVTEYLFFCFLSAVGRGTLRFLDYNNFYTSIKVVLDHLYELFNIHSKTSCFMIMGSPTVAAPPDTVYECFLQINPWVASYGPVFCAVICHLNSIIAVLS